MSRLAAYFGPISSAVWVFPFVALVFTVPYVLTRYHKYGAVLFLRALMVYSFIFYLLCVYFLGVLPLPSFEYVASLTSRWAQIVPFHELRLALRAADFTLLEPASWLRAIKTSQFFQIAANVAMLFPLGVYMRYYFRKNLRRTLLWGFLISLSVELLQLSGLLFIYPRPYRLFDVDDLIANTLGAALGYAFAPLPMRILPSRERLDRAAYRKGERVSITRAFAAAAIDWLACAPVAVPLSRLSQDRSLGAAGAYAACVLCYFILAQYLARGRTLGKWLCRMRLAAEDGGAPKIWQVAARYVWLYLVLLAAPFFGLRAWNAMIDATGWRFFALGAAAVLCLGAFALFVFSCFVYMFTRASQLPHDRLSRTRNQSTVRPE